MFFIYIQPYILLIFHAFTSKSGEILDLGQEFPHNKSLYEILKCRLKMYK